MRTSYNSGNNPTYAVEGQFTSLPWGDAQATASGSDYDAYHFAMLDYDSETGTDHAEFRQYSSTPGSWMRPDPYAGSYDPSNPQSFNRYAYAMNNPLSAVDPSGLILCDYGPNEDGSEDLEDADNSHECTSHSGAVVQGQTTITVPADPWAIPVVIEIVYFGNSTSGPGAPGGGGGGGSAPNNGTKSPSCGKAWGKAIAGTLLDATGLIPGEGTIASGIKIVGTLGGIALSAYWLISGCGCWRCLHGRGHVCRCD